MKKITLFIISFFLSASLFSQAEMGFDIGQPIDPVSGAINAGTDTTIVGATCTPWVRVNFILGPWSSPSDATLHSGRTWLQAYNEIVNGFIAKGIRIYALIGAEAYYYPGGILEQYPGNDSALTVAWIDGYTANFVEIVDLFKDRINVFESYNEPNNWTNSNTAIVHPAWFSLLLQDIYLNTKYFNGHDTDLTWQVNLVSGALFTFDLNSGAQYINDTYWYGKNIFAWDWTHANAGAYPLDGFGMHIYVEQGSSSVTQVTNAMNFNLNDFWNSIYMYEDDPNKKIWVSEFGWESYTYGEQFQSDNLTTGFDVLQNDSRVALGLWFTLSDFPGGDWGLFYMGNYLPSEQKLAYNTFRSRLNCSVVTSVSKKENGREIKLIGEKDNYFIQTNFSSEEHLLISVYNLNGQKIYSLETNAVKNKIPLSTINLPPSIYFVEVETDHSREAFKFLTN